MNFIDFGYILFYLVLVLLLTVFTYHSKWSSVFSVSKKVKWWIAGTSIFISGASINGPQLISGILHKQGLWGMWLFWSSSIFMAVVPILFAPLWAKLNFITDNQFILLRYSGLGAKVLHQFRAIYVGALVVALLLSFQVLAFANVITLYFNISFHYALLCSGIILVLYSFKNAFEHKLQTDALHTIIYISFLIFGGIYILTYAGGWTEVIETIEKTHPEKLKIFPSMSEPSSVNTVLIYMAVMWWSTQMFDGGGPEAQRYFSTKDRWSTIKAAFLPYLLNNIVLLFLIVIVFSGMALEYRGIVAEDNPERAFITYFLQILPNGLKGFSLLAFFAAFITTAESLMNWGASFLVVDVYKRHIPDKTETHYVKISIFAMSALSIISFLFAYYNDSLNNLIHLFLSISAGVAPVFILRWVWMRINAWSQISAMLSSLFYTNIINYYFDNANFEAFNLEFHSFRLIVVTILTTITWLIVTYSTSKDDALTIDNFKKTIPVGHFSFKQIGFILLIGVFITAIIVWFYYEVFT